ncbi:MAG TPA: hypothetical protein VF292_01095 [Rhodanobacteraceae bacterium]
MIDKLKHRLGALLAGDAHDDAGDATRDAAGEPAADPRERAQVVALLQSYRASESLNARYCGLWSRVSPDARMRGGLRLVQAREGTHARLMRERLKELGETQFDDVSQARQDQAIAFFADGQRSDVRKLRELKPMLDDFDGYFRSLMAEIEAIHGDPCTRELLRTIIDDERSTTYWFARMYKDLAGGKAAA